jgi:hypothetical protein
MRHRRPMASRAKIVSNSDKLLRTGTTLEARPRGTCGGLIRDGLYHRKEAKVNSAYAQI